MTGQADRELWVVRLGRMGYEECLELQREVARQRISGEIPQDVLLLVESHDRLVAKIECEKSMTPIARGSAGNPC